MREPRKMRLQDMRSWSIQFLRTTQSYFITSLYRQKCNLEAKIAAMGQKQHGALSGASRDIMALFEKKSVMGMADIVHALGKNPATIRKSVQNLVKKGFLRKLGTTRGASYTHTHFGG